MKKLIKNQNGIAHLALIKKIGNYTYEYQATKTTNCTDSELYGQMVEQFTIGFKSIQASN